MSTDSVSPLRQRMIDTTASTHILTTRERALAPASEAAREPDYHQRRELEQAALRRMARRARGGARRAIPREEGFPCRHAMTTHCRH